MNYASFGQRLVAFLIDALILGIINWIVTMLLGGVLGEAGSMVAIVIQIAISVGYWVFYQEKMGQTVGKKVMKIKVVDASGNLPPVGTLFLREIVGKFVSGIILGIGYLWMLWDPKKQCLHDKIATTYVVKA
jgi:uncharacterized RDD family membrane protein YckC